MEHKTKLSSLDLSVKSNAERSKNFTALVGILVMDILFILAYFIEYIKGARSLGSYAVIAVICILSIVLSLGEYFRRKDSVLFRYISSILFSLMYAYVMFTSSTDLAFCYVIVLFVVMMVYSDLKLSIGLAVFASVINLILIIQQAMSGQLTGVAVTNAEIKMACLGCTALFAILAISKINKINAATVQKADDGMHRSQELLQTVLRVSDSITDKIVVAVEETESLKTSIGITQSSMTELVAGTNDTVQAIDAQMDSTNQINGYIEDVEAAVKTIMQEIRTTEDKIEAGNVIMSELLQQVKVSEDSSELVAREMNDLSEYVNKMQDIMGLISSIAHQTGMLALNASIEAARAGEAGRGFAVVASQISSLAAQTNQATGDINGLIANVTKSVEAVSGSMSTLLESNKLQNGYVDESAQNFKQIHTSTQEIVEQAEQLEKNVDSVLKANTQVTESISNVSAATEEITASANETMESCNVNLQTIEMVAEIMNELGTEASELRNTHNSHEE